MTTPNLGLTLPTVGADSDDWGTVLNTAFTAMDALWATIGDNAFGSVAVKSVGTSGATVPLLSTANTWTLAQTFTVAPVFTDASGTRTALGLGTAALKATGTSGATVPLLNGTNTWSGAQTFSGGLSGALTGDVTGNVSGSSGSCTGNAATATTAAACSGNAATATTADVALQVQSTGSSAANSIFWNGSGWVFNVGGVSVGIVNGSGFVNLV